MGQGKALAMENLKIYFQIELSGKEKKLNFLKKLIPKIKASNFYLIAEDKNKKSVSNLDEINNESFIKFVCSKDWHPTRIKLYVASFDNTNAKFCIDLIDDEFIVYGSEEDRLFIEDLFYD